MTKEFDNTKLVAFCGSRGLPARYGGFETAVDEITLRLVRKGVSCEVFCRAASSDNLPRVDRGRHLTYVKGSRYRKLDTFVSSFQTGLHLWRNRKKYTYAFWFNNANLPGILLTRLAGIPMSVNTDGLEWRRAKWSAPFKAYYYVSSFLIARMCRSLIADSLAIQSFYRERFGVESHFVPYGTPTVPPVSPERATAILNRLGLERRKYFLQITRFEPDNLPLEVARAFRKSGLAQSGTALAVVGYQGHTEYADQLKDLHGSDGIHVLNATYDPEVLRVLRQYCYCYVHGNSVGGTNPALLEAMANCPRIAAIDSPFSHEVLGGGGLYFDPIDIGKTLVEAMSTRDESGDLQKQVGARYQWDAVAESYLRLAQGLASDYTPATEASTQTRQPDARAMTGTEAGDREAVVLH